MIFSQIRNADSISADPDRIRSQISDNISLMEELKHKEGVLLSVKEQAREIMEKAKLNDTAVDGNFVYRIRFRRFDISFTDDFSFRYQCEDRSS